MFRMFAVVSFIITLLLSMASVSFAKDELVKDPYLKQVIQETLRLGGTSPTEEDLKQLKTLYPQDTTKKISTLEGLQYAINLNALYLPHFDVSDITQIKDLTKLFILALSDNRITNIEPLRELKGLKKVYLHNNNITSIDALSEITGIEDLVLENNKITDLSPISNMNPKLLVLSRNKISNLEAVRSMTKLKDIYFDHNEVQDISVLEALPSLKFVALEGNPLNEESIQVINRLKQKGVEFKQLEHEQTKSEIHVILDTKEMQFDVAPFMKDGSVMVPFRSLFEKLGLTISWEPETKTILGTKEGLEIRLQIGNKNASVNDASLEMPLAPVIRSDLTFIPLRFVAEATGSQVNWDQELQTAVIRAKHVFTTRNGKFQITVFGKWSILGNTEDSQEIFLGMSSASHRYVIVRSPGKNQSFRSLTEYYEAMKNGILVKPQNTLKEELDVEFKGFKARQFTFRSADDEFDSFNMAALCVDKNGTFYMVLYGAVEEDYEDASSELNEILKSIEFL